ncbi:MAG: hypothetical protein M4579_006373 [Chaenotheca gracillima]|nr:MAG: hypothetical protein M4579_006373 [Chaenotheca gracillima]
MLASSPNIRDAGEKLKVLLDEAADNSTFGMWNTTITSFSIALTDSSSTLWSYQHTASGTVNGTKNVTADSQYRIASITKTFTDLALLRAGLDLTDPVTKYLPELEDPDSPIQYKDITLGMLGSHLSGMPPNYGFPEDILVAPYLEQAGFPHLKDSEYPPCGVIGLNGGCTQQQLFDGLKKVQPVAAPNSRPIYGASIPFALLGYVLQNVTGKSYAEVLDQEIFQPLGLENTGLKAKSNETGVIPPVENNLWFSDLGDNNPSGGIFSTSNDLAVLLRAILDRSILPASRIQSWLKPSSMTPSLNAYVGFPWEIVRASLLPDYPEKITDIYAKDGGVPGYYSRFALIDEYGIGFNVLVAGDTLALNQIVEALLATFIPVIEKTTREEANTTYSGLYTNDTSPGANLTLSIDDGPGLKIDGLYRNGSEILSTLQTVRSQSLGFPATDTPPDSRLLATGMTHTEGDEEKEEWRLMLTITDGEAPKSSSGLPSRGVYDVDKTCLAWQLADNLYYGGLSLERFVIVKKGGKVVRVEMPALRTAVEKAE